MSPYVKNWHWKLLWSYSFKKLIWSIAGRYAPNLLSHQLMIATSRRFFLCTSSRLVIRPAVTSSCLIIISCASNRFWVMSLAVGMASSSVRVVSWVNDFSVTGAKAPSALILSAMTSTAVASSVYWVSNSLPRYARNDRGYKMLL